MFTSYIYRHLSFQLYLPFGVTPFHNKNLTYLIIIYIYTYIYMKVYMKVFIIYIKILKSCFFSYISPHNKFQRLISSLFHLIFIPFLFVFLISYIHPTAFSHCYFSHQTFLIAKNTKRSKGLTHKESRYFIPI